MSKKEILEQKGVDPGKARQLLEVCYEIQRPVFLLGSPGVGKSSIVRQFCEARKLDLIDVRLSLLNPVDLRGVPFLDKEKSVTRWLPPGFLPRSGRGVLFLDEINAAPATVQASSYQLILDRRIGEYVLPDGWYVMGAGNRMSDRSVTFEMPSALKNRFVILEVKPTLSAWKDWAINAGIHPMIVGFLNFREELLFQFDPDRFKQAFPTPRSWEFVSRILGKVGVNGIESVYELIRGCVGDGPASEFVGFVSVQKDLPDIDGIIEGKIKEWTSDNPSVMYAVSSALVSGVLAKKDLVKSLRSVCEFVTVNFQPEFAVVTLMDVMRAEKYVKVAPVFRQTEEFKRFVRKFGDLIVDAR